ncbi:MAG: hypothetical protein ACFFFC_00885 [Candidatus Thorarchaeota archaeon]
MWSRINSLAAEGKNSRRHFLLLCLEHAAKNWPEKHWWPTTQGLAAIRKKVADPFSKIVDPDGFLWRVKGLPGLPGEIYWALMAEELDPARIERTLFRVRRDISWSAFQKAYTGRAHKDQDRVHNDELKFQEETLAKMIMENNSVRVDRISSCQKATELCQEWKKLCFSHTWRKPSAQWICLDNMFYMVTGNTGEGENTSFCYRLEDVVNWMNGYVECPDIDPYNGDFCKRVNVVIYPRNLIHMINKLILRYLCRPGSCEQIIGAAEQQEWEDKRNMMNV